jgi:hypothetical protein
MRTAAHCVGILLLIVAALLVGCLYLEASKKQSLEGLLTGLLRLKAGPLMRTAERPAQPV